MHTKHSGQSCVMFELQQTITMQLQLNFVHNKFSFEWHRWKHMGSYMHAVQHSNKLVYSHIQDCQLKYTAEIYHLCQARFLLPEFMARVDRCQKMHPSWRAGLQSGYSLLTFSTERQWLPYSNANFSSLEHSSHISACYFIAPSSSQLLV